MPQVACVEIIHHILPQPSLSNRNFVFQFRDFYDHLRTLAQTFYIAHRCGRGLLKGAMSSQNTIGSGAHCIAILCSSLSPSFYNLSLFLSLPVLNVFSLFFLSFLPSLVFPLFLFSQHLAQGSQDPSCPCSDRSPKRPVRKTASPVRICPLIETYLGQYFFSNLPYFNLWIAK